MDRATREERLRRLAAATARAHDAYVEERNRRNVEIDTAYAEGWGVREIAREAKLAPQTIEQVLMSAARARQAAT
jgi:DNA-binding NarL/FixJ family response regulator